MSKSRRRKKQQQKGSFRKIRVKGSSIFLQAGSSGSSVSGPINDPNNPRTTKLTSVIQSRIMVNIPFVYCPRKDASGKIKVWRGIKENPAIISFKDMDDTSRSSIVNRLLYWGNTPSCLFLELLGLTARQVGAIRRYHIPNWRNLNNQYLRRALNKYRVVI